MSFHSQIQSDLSKVLNSSVGPGEDVLLQATGQAKEVKIRACFEQAAELVSMGLSAGIASTSPVLHMREEDYLEALGRKLSQRDVIVCRAKSYRLEQPQPDGFGMVTVKLLEVG